MSAQGLNRVGIVYCAANTFVEGREQEKLADCEVIEVAEAIQGVLDNSRIPSEIIRINPQRMDELCRFDWVFNLAETVCGFPLKDFQVAEALEKLGIHFTGAGSWSLKSCRDKAFTKSLLASHGIQTPDFEVFDFHDPIHTLLRYPLFVKPLYEDGSIGITKDSMVNDLLELAIAVEDIHRVYQQPALVEEFIVGKDITASILGNGADAVVMPLSEIVYPNQNGTGFLSFEAKWLPESCEYSGSISRSPCVDLDSKAEAGMIEFGKRAFQLLQCRDYARVDFRLKGNEPYVLEVNPNPCINPHGSGFILAGNAAGMDFAEIILRILACAIQDQSLIAELAPYDIKGTPVRSGGS